MNHIARSLRIMTVCGVVALLTVAPSVAQDDLENWQRAELRALLDGIHAALDGRIVPDGGPFEFRADFIKATDGETYVPFTVSIDPENLDVSSLAMYVYVSDQLIPVPRDDDDRPQPVFEYATFTEVDVVGSDPIRISRALQIPGGEYDIYVAIRESSRDLAPDENRVRPADRARIDEYCGGLFSDDLSMRFACQEQEYLAYRLQQRPRLSYSASEESATMMMLRTRVEVPDLWNGQPQLSTVILSESIEMLTEPLSPDVQERNPYTIGPFRIVPKLDADFGKRDNLSQIFFVYNTGLVDGGKPDVTIEYNFYMQTAGGEEYFNRTAPQEFNSQTLPPEFDVTLGYQVMGGQQGVNLAVFPAGDYRLEIKVTDNTDSTEIIENVMFTVLES